MLKFRTTKKVQTSIHNNDTNILEYHFWYKRMEGRLEVRINAYKVIDEDTLELLPDGCKTDVVIDDRLKQIEPLDNLIAENIKQGIVDGGYLKGALTIVDFE